MARLEAKNTITEYDRGVRWKEEDFEVKGDSWKSAYLPVWLYSYMQTKGKKNLLHYVAVNARTLETMGSVPINFTKLYSVSILIEIFGGILAFIITTFAAMEKFNGTDFQDYRNYAWLLLLSGFVFFVTMYLRYRNANARHHYELETKHAISNLVCEDNFVTSIYSVRNSQIWGDNTDELKGNKLDLSKDKVLKKAMDKGVLDEALENQNKLEEKDQ